ncbi:hypothetical protein BCR42DRAFT_424608 [Absidia repens]|uniref:DUF7082 domain-containing protein n=1 Tax=Absidia repens TaxID=90262 RepID=A0A1X2I3S6_9FUNG|nr:hypothetical protein BCR42DRAFT_424608 [Absidia repens]
MYKQQYTNVHSTTSSNDWGTAMWITQEVQQQQQPQHSDQQYLFENVNLVNASFMDNLSFHYNSMVPKYYGSCHDNQYKQKSQFHALHDSFLDANITHRGDHAPNNTMITAGFQYNSYQDIGMRPQANINDGDIKNAVFNNSSISSSNNSNLCGLLGDDLHYSFSPSRNYSNAHSSNELDTIGSNKISYIETKTPPSYNMTNVRPFGGLLNKANLKICGDLMQMTFQWSADEWKKGRRLVRFWRRQNTSNAENSQQVECVFEPIECYNHQQEQQQQHFFHMNGMSSDQLPMPMPNESPNSPLSPLDDHAYFSNHPAIKSELMASVKHNSSTTTGMAGTSSLVVSCIYWKERNDYFITSVDCIYLLEGLTGNRIRRNLEGFHPLTVSKYKTGCADFFKLIMGFSHPKPRNIEKDVKVFSWNTLPHALRKIIRKYTPSYSSSATLARTPASA